MYEEPDGVGKLKRLLAILVFMIILSATSAGFIIYYWYKQGYVG